MSKNGETLVLRTVIVGLVTLLVGLLLISIAIYLERGSWSWPIFVGTIGATILVGGVATCLQEWLTRRDFLGTIKQHVDQIRQLIAVSKNMDRLGLYDVDVDCNTYDFSQLIATSKRLIVCVNDGRTWLSRNSEFLKERFSQPDRSTVFVIMHPDSPALQIQADKVGTTLEALRIKVNELLAIIKRLRHSRTDLKIYGHNFTIPNPSILEMI